MVAKVRGPVNQRTNPDVVETDSDSDYDFDDDEDDDEGEGYVSEPYDGAFEPELKEAALRNRHKRSSLAFSDGELNSSAQFWCAK